MLGPAVPAKLTQRHVGESFNLWIVGIQNVGVIRNNDPALSTDQLLHLTVHLMALGCIGLGQGIFQQFTHAVTVPVSVVPVAIGAKLNTHHRVRSRAHVP